MSHVALEPPPVAASTLPTRHTLRRRLASDSWAVVSAERARFSRHENAARTARLWADLVHAGTDFVEASGCYDGVREASFVILGANAELIALTFARAYQQESILLPNRLQILADVGKGRPLSAFPVRSLSFNVPATGDHTAIDCADGRLTFVADIDWHSASVAV
jgi:hypothetical protein